MKCGALLLVVSLVTPSLSQLPPGSRLAVHVDLPNHGAVPAAITAGGARSEASVKNNDLGNVLGTVSEVWARFWSQELPQLLADKATNASDKEVDGARSQMTRDDSQCLDDFAQLFETYREVPFNLSLGFQALDAFGKLGSDILDGNVNAYGSFDECFEIGEDIVQYVVAPVALVPQRVDSSTDVLLLFKMGMCVPQSCNGTDIQNFIYEIDVMLSLIPQFNYFLYIEPDTVIATKSKEVPYSAGAIVMIVVCALFASMVLISSAVDTILKWVGILMKESGLSVNRDPEKPTEQSPLLGRVRYNKGTPKQWKPLDFLFAFSLFKNVPMILATKQPPNAITSLNGIRVLSMFWVILCHTPYWVAVTELITNPLVVITKVAPRFSFQAILGGFFAVDSFFFLSGALVAYLTLREMERRRGWFRFPFITYYLHRYLRLTMVYAFVLFFYWTLTVHLGDGNTWIAATGPDSPVQKNCERYWWTNLLYINNLYPWKLEDECLGWSWYLANDMQFYVIAPLIIIPLFFFFPIGLAVSGVFLAASFAATGVIAGVNDFSANVFQQTPNATPEYQQSDDIYIKPYCRIAPYLVGLVLGYMLHKKVRFPFHFLVNWVMYLCLWIIAAWCCMSTLYGLYDTWHGHELSRAENVSYYMFSRFTWAMGLALMVFACHNGYGWVINDFLSMKFWIPLSRLTYTAYLVHPIVLTVIFSTLRDPFTYSDNILTVYAIANVVLSYGVAGVVATFVEFPLSNLEMTIFKVVGLRLRESTRRVEVHRKEGSVEAHHTPPPSPHSSDHHGDEPEKTEPN